MRAPAVASQQSKATASPAQTLVSQTEKRIPHLFDTKVWQTKNKINNNNNN
jgi:hypothetical protein